MRRPAHPSVLTQPTMGGPPKKRRAWGRDTLTPGVLPPEEQAVVGRFLRWLQPLRELPRFKDMMATADRAASGQAIVMEDYTGPLAAHQAGQKIGGSASRHSRQFQRLFPEQRYKALHLALMNKIAFTWKSEAEQAAIRQGSPGHDFSAGRVQYLDEAAFEGYRRHQKKLREDGVAINIDPRIVQFYIKYFTIDKLDSNGEVKGTRHIHNAKAENILQHRIPQRLTGVRSLAASLRRGWWQLKIDFAQWFYQHSLQWRESLRLCVRGPVHKVTGERLEDDAMVQLPMGARQAPGWASRYTQALVHKTNELGAVGLGYVDEIHQQRGSPHGAYVVMMLTAAATSFLGWQLGWDKMEIWPVIEIEFLGLLWNTQLMRRQARWGRRRKLCAAALASFEAHVEGQRVTIKEKASFLGQMMSAQAGAREFGLQATHLKAEHRWDLRAHRQNYTARVKVGSRFATICRYIVMSGDDKWWGHVRKGPSQGVTTVDASCFAWGAQMIDAPPGSRQNMRDRFRPEELKCNHTVLEQVGTHRAVAGMAQAHGISGTHERAVTLTGETDNMAVRSVVNKEATRSTEMAVRQLSFMRRVLDPRHLQLNMVWISGQTMVDRRTADAQSRVLTKWHEWPMHMAVVLATCASLGVERSRLVDVFAERSTARARRYLAWEGDASEALYRNALSRPVCCTLNPAFKRTDVLWAFPPPLLLRAWWELYEAAREPPDLILVVPALAGKHQLHEWARWCNQVVLLPPTTEIIAPPEGEHRPADAAPAVYPRFRLLALSISKRCAGGQDSRPKTGSTRAFTDTPREMTVNNTTRPLTGSSPFAWVRDLRRTSAR